MARALDLRRALPFAPGLGAVAAVTAAAWVAAAVVGAVNPLVWSVLLGMGAAAVVGRPAPLASGVALASRPLLRVGVALLGLRVSAPEIGTIGWRGVVVVVVTVAASALGIL